MSTARIILAQNLTALMKRLNVSTASLEAATIKTGRKVGKSSIDRALKGEAPLNVDDLDAIAACFGVPTASLLTEGAHQ